MLEAVFAIITCTFAYIGFVLGRVSVLRKLPEFEVLMISQTMTLLAKFGYLKHEIKENGELLIHPLDGENDGQGFDSTSEDEEAI